LEVARAVAGELRSPDLDLVVDGQPTLVVADPDRLRTIVAGLVEAAQWWGERGPVRLEVRGGELRVWREGTSFSPQQAEDLFAPRRPGTGGGSKVGLFVAKGLAEAHGGMLLVEARGGIRFEVRLPGAAG